VSSIKIKCEHSACSRYHVVTWKHRITCSEYFMCSLLWPSRICSINYIILYYHNKSIITCKRLALCASSMQADKVLT